MAKSKLIIDIIAKDKASAATKKATGAFDGLQKAVTVSAGAIAAVTAAVVAAKKAFDMGKEGAVISQTTASFNSLEASLGPNVDLLEQLQQASGGTVDAVQLMSSTMTLVVGTSEELQKTLLGTSPRILEIAKAANKLNPLLGSTADLYESLMSGIKRSSPLLIDNTGLTLKIGEANQAYADQLGKTVEELTATETQMALLNATLEAGETLITQAGGAAGSAVDPYEKLEAQVNNLTAALKENVNKGIKPFVSELANAVEEVNEVQQQHELLKSSLEAGLVTQEEYTRITRMQGRASEQYDDQIRLLEIRLGLLNSTGAKTIDFYETYAPAIEEATIATEEQTEAYSNADAILAGLNGNLDEQIANMQEMAANGEDTSEAMADINAELMSMVGNVGVLTLLESGLAGSEQAAYDLALSLGLMDEATYNANTTMANLNGYLSDTSDVDGYAAAVSWMANNLDRLEDKTYTVTQIIKTMYQTSGAADQGAGSGLAREEIRRGEDLNGNGIIGAANGFSGMVDSPQLFLAGEAGAEHVQITPTAPGSAYGGGMTIIINNPIVPDAEAFERIIEPAFDKLYRDKQVQEYA